MAESFLFSKIVDMSTLYEGISIPVAFQPTVFDKLGFSLARGEQASIQVELMGLIYDDAIIKNQWFDGAKYPNRKDIVQIRYPRSSTLAKKIRHVFSNSLAIVDEYVSSRGSDNKLLVIPENEREYISLYVDKGIIRFDCISRPSGNNNTDEYGYGEDIPQKKDVVTSVFKRSAEVVNQAKAFAKGVCQLCGNSAPFIDKENKPYLEVHHIVWLSRGGADTISNAIALCPNCHSKMHVVDDPREVSFLMQKAKSFVEEV